MIGEIVTVSVVVVAMVEYMVVLRTSAMVNCLVVVMILVSVVVVILTCIIVSVSVEVEVLVIICV